MILLVKDSKLKKKKKDSKLLHGTIEWEWLKELGSLIFKYLYLHVEEQALRLFPVWGYYKVDIKNCQVFL